MKKDDQYHKNKKGEEGHEVEPQFSDASYSIDMRVDPLTTQDAIREELSELSKNKAERQAAQQKIAQEAEAEERKQYEAWKASKSEPKEADRNAKEDDVGG